MTAPRTEAELAAVVVAWLEAQGADVFQEVACATGIADIVARVGAELWIVETKTSLSLAVVTQAMDRRREAHRVFVAAPATRNTRDVAALLDEIGVGMLVVSIGSGHAYDQPRVTERVPSRRWNRRPVTLAAQLRPEHKTHAPAGSVGGGRWTPFRGTCEELARFVRDTPGVELRTAIKAIRHHYGSNSIARSSLTKWIRDGVVAGVALRDGALWPTEAR